MHDLLRVDLFVAFKIEESVTKKTYWIAGEIKEIRKDSYLLKVPFHAYLPFKFDEIVDMQVLEH